MSVEKTLVVSYGAKTSTTMPAATETMVVEMAVIPVLASAAITEMQSIAKTMTPTTTETIVVEMDQVPLVVVNAAIKEMLSMIAAKIQPVMVRYTNNHTMTTIISSPKITIFKGNLVILLMIKCIITMIYQKHRTIYTKHWTQMPTRQSMESSMAEIETMMIRPIAIPGRVPAAVSPASKSPTMTYTMIEIDWVSMVIPVMTLKNDNVKVDMAVSP